MIMLGENKCAEIQKMRTLFKIYTGTLQVRNC